MASNDYDDLLKSFMSNSTKAYNEDKTSRENGSNVPASYSLSSADDKKAKKIQRGRDIEKELVQKQEKKLKKKRAKQNKTPAQKALSNFGKVILGAVMVIGVVGIVCFSVLAIYGYSVVYGDPVFDLTTEAKVGQNQTSFIYGYDGDDVVEITRLHGEENRIWVNLDDMSKYIPEAFVSIEDKRFYKHHGVDWIRTIGVFFKDYVEALFGSGLLVVGVALLITACLLAFAYYARPRLKTDISFRDAFIIGVAQACAVLPGLSRSGSTIATGILLGNNKENVARFSFLMVLVPILGEAFLDMMKGGFAPAESGTSDRIQRSGL